MTKGSLALLLLLTMSYYSSWEQAIRDYIDQELLLACRGGNVEACGTLYPLNPDFQGVETGEPRALPPRAEP